MNRTPLKPLAALILAALTARAGLAQTPTNWDGAANGGTNDLNLTISSLQGLPAPEVKAAAVPIRRDVGAWKAALSLKAKIAAARAQALRSLPAGAARKRELSASVKLSDGSQALLAQSDAKPAPPSSSAPKAQASALTKTYTEYYRIDFTRSDYVDDMYELWDYQLAPEGAEWIAVNFDWIDMEGGYDYVYVVDGDGNICWSYSGYAPFPVQSAQCPGNYAGIWVYTDGSYSGADGYYGFSSSGFDYGITPPDPIAIATADRYSLTVGETVSFDGSQSYVPNLDATITAYRWSFGDGGADGNGATASHSYDNPGNYTVTLTVTDSAGNSGTDSFQVVVGNVLPPINLTSSAPTKYSLEFQWQPGDAYDTEGFVVDFDEGDGSNLSCATGFDIGYSAAAAYSGLKSNTTYSFLICAYNEAGRYSVGRLMTVRTAAPLPVTMAASQFGTNYMKIAFTAREAGRRYQLMSRPTLSPGASWQPVAGALVTSTTLNEPLGFIVPESLAQQQMFFSVVSQ